MVQNQQSFSLAAKWWSDISQFNVKRGWNIILTFGNWHSFHILQSESKYNCNVHKKVVQSAVSNQVDWYKSKSQELGSRFYILQKRATAAPKYSLNAPIKSALQNAVFQFAEHSHYASRGNYETSAKASSPEVLIIKFHFVAPSLRLLLKKVKPFELGKKFEFRAFQWDSNL